MKRDILLISIFFALLVVIAFVGYPIVFGSAKQAQYDFKIHKNFQITKIDLKEASVSIELNSEYSSYEILNKEQDYSYTLEEQTRRHLSTRLGKIISKDSEQVVFNANKIKGDRKGPVIIRYILKKDGRLFVRTNKAEEQLIFKFAKDVFADPVSIKQDFKASLTVKEQPGKITFSKTTNNVAQEVLVVFKDGQGDYLDQAYLVNIN